MSHKYLCAAHFGLLGTANNHASRTTQQMPRKQAGVVLFITLIALVAMTLAAIALVRSIDTGNTVAGNLAFKQGATLASDSAAEAAITVLAAFADQAGSYTDNASIGYYATSQTTLDMTGSKNLATLARVDWDDNNCSGTSQSACIDASAQITLGNGYKARYIIHRLCGAEGEPGTANCATYEAPATSTSGGAKGEIKQGGGKLTPPTVTYYRITTRVSGPRNTSSFTETILHY